MTKLSLRQVEAGYGARAVLAGVDVQIEPGEFWGIVGPNGAGKSTLLRTISRALPPRAGAILLDGQDMARLEARDVARRLAFMAAEVRDGLAFRVEEYVSFGRTPYQNWLGQPRAADEQAVRQALAVTRTAALADRRLEDLSSGERQRVQLAQALAQEPQVLLLDEPTAHLDLNYQVEMMHLLGRVAASGTSLIAVLHELNLAIASCHKLLVVHAGRVLAMGPPATVITPAVMATVYGDAVAVHAQPETGLPYVLPRLHPTGA